MKQKNAFLYVISKDIVTYFSKKYKNVLTYPKATYLHVVK